MKKENKTQKRQQAKKIMRQYELPLSLAWSVVNNECSLHEAIIQSRSEVEQALLKSQHGLDNRELALIQSGDASLTEILVKKQYKEHIDDTDANPLLQVSTAGYFWIHHKDVFAGEVINSSQYDVELLTQEGTLSLSKLHIKAFASTLIEPIHNTSSEVEPIIRIEERFRISNRLLYQFVLEETTVYVVLLGGLTFMGVFQQVGRYECVLAQDDGTTVVLMRHAFSSVNEVK